MGRRRNSEKTQTFGKLTISVCEPSIVLLKEGIDLTIQSEHSSTTEKRHAYFVHYTIVLHTTLIVFVLFVILRVVNCKRCAFHIRSGVCCGLQHAWHRRVLCGRELRVGRRRIYGEERGRRGRGRRGYR